MMHLGYVPEECFELWKEKGLLWASTLCDAELSTVRARYTEVNHAGERNDLISQGWPSARCISGSRCKAALRCGSRAARCSFGELAGAVAIGWRLRSTVVVQFGDRRAVLAMSGSVSR